MDYITTTQLRTQTTRLVELMKANKSVTVLHRSKVIGHFNPDTTLSKKPLTETDIGRLKKLFKELSGGKKTTLAERERIYRKRLEEKYGKPVL